MLELLSSLLFKDVPLAVLPPSPTSTCNTALLEYSCQPENMVKRSPSFNQTASPNHLTSPYPLSSYYPILSFSLLYNSLTDLSRHFFLHNLSSCSFSNTLQLGFCSHYLATAVVKVAKDLRVSRRYSGFSIAILLGLPAMLGKVAHTFT